MSRSGFTAAGALLIALLLVYLPGLPGGFAFDDYHAIVDNPALDLPDGSATALLDAALSAGNTGPFARPLAMLSFAANRTLGGLDPLPWKLVNLALHGLNALLLAALLARLLPLLAPRAPAGLAWALAAVWALHPLNLSAVLYVVQRMTSLSASFVLLALLLYLAARQRQIAGHAAPRGWRAGVALLGLAGVLAKETALCLPLYLLVLEAMVFAPRRPPWSPAARRLAALAAVLALALAAVAYQVMLAPGYAGREFTLAERLWTETRVLCTYLGMLVVPWPPAFSLFHDDLVLSSGPFAPPATALALAFLLAVSVAVLRPGARRAQPWLAFGWTWFLVGHALEGSVAPLELMHEHRNYLPMLGILVMLGVPLAQALARPAARRGALLLVLVVVSGVTAFRASLWRDPARQVESELAWHPQSPRLWYEAGRLRMERAAADPAMKASAIVALERAARLAPQPALPLGALLKLAVQWQDAGAVARLVPVIAAERRESVGIDVFEALVMCQGYAGCRKDGATTQALAQALLRRPDLSEEGRGQVMEWLAVWFARVLGDPATAVTMLRDLVATRPANLALAARLAEAELAAGQHEAAQATARAAWARLPAGSAYTRRALYMRLRQVLEESGALAHDG